MDKTLIICLACCGLGAVIVGLMLGDTIIERIRRKKHPKWYELYNRAKNNAFRAGGEFSAKLDTICARGEMLGDMLYKGACSKDEYLEAMKVLEKERVEAVEQYHLNQDALGIEVDLKEADAYAKEHNLKWGIIYD